LDEQALLAKQDVQRIEHLGRLDILGREITLAERRHPKVDERTCQFRPA
jgi:hypothetical protein